MSSAGPRVLLVSDETETRLALRRLIAPAADITIVGSSRLGEHATDSAVREGANLVIVDCQEGSDAVMATVRALRARSMRVLSLISQGPTRPSAPPPTLERPPNLRDTMPGSVFAKNLCEKLRSIATDPAPQGNQPELPAAVSHLMARLRPAAAPHLLAIGSSTGGPQALATVLSGINGRIQQPVIVTQHMPGGFTAMLAEQLRRSGIDAVEAEEGMPLASGRIHIAPGGRHLLVARKEGAGVHCVISDAPPENFCRPAVDPMLRSAVDSYGGRILAVILTGMGSDGMLGCRTLVDAGGTVIAQDRATSIVWGMPGAVVQAGLARSILPLTDIAPAILDICQARKLP